MAAYIASIQPFDLSNNENWVEYSERFDNFLVANKITDADLKRATLLATIGAPGYKLLRSLCQNAPGTKTYEELKAAMKNHLQPAPNVIAERFRFYKRDRKAGETVAVYLAELRKLSEYCEFLDKLDEYLRDRFVCGLNSERVQQKLLSTKDLTLKKATEIALSFEAASKEAKVLQGGGASGGASGGGDDAVHRLGGQQQQNQGRKECYRCGSFSHLANGCPFRTKSCYGCGKVGHPKWKCEVKRGEEDRSKQVGGQRSGVHNLGGAASGADVGISGEGSGDGGVSGTLDLLELYLVETASKHEPVFVELSVNGQVARMELDTGAAVSVMSLGMYERIRGGGQGRLQESKLRLKTYTGELVKPEGVGEVEVKYGQQCCMLPVTVVKGSVPALMGRDWIARLKLNWEELFPAVATNMVGVDDRVARLLEGFPDVFTDELGCLRDFKVHIPVSEQAQPKFFKPRPVPYALRSRVEDELDKMEQQGVWKRVSTPDGQPQLCQFSKTHETQLGRYVSVVTIR